MVKTIENAEFSNTQEQKVITRERKIGTTTFIVSSSFSNGIKRDVVSVISRLIENDAISISEKESEIV